MRFAELLGICRAPWIRPVFIPALLACFCGGVWPQSLMDNAALLGLARSELPSRFAAAQPVRTPRRLSSGALGLFRVPDVVLEGMHFEQTLYFNQQRLEQTELVPVNAGPDAYGALVQSLRTQLGPELASSASSPGMLMDTASWVQGEADVMLFRSGRADHPVVRLVIRRRQLQDASTL